ncbi:hypothetical protein FACS189421_07220 [Bacteroidia bacterium]|nr:hypothetical protein FACS189421_07220 [Bacteroidia bacterium]GHT03268.1 hypothetical protein FACS189423_03780 [Bacteroidia bacterium]GHT45559.1 hypothetical protein FACS189440_01760 [Bacteroidia bacterium]
MKSDDEILQRIARYLMLHGSFTNNIGLLNGKTGIALFLYHYFRYTGKKLYDDFAGELIDEIYKEIHLETPLNFKDGLCGIAWGMEYLIKNRFVDANPDEILEDLDKRIVEWDVRRITDHSLETGLKGIAVYVTSRCENRGKDNPYITKEYIRDLIEVLKNSKDNIYDDKINPVYNIVAQIKYKSIFKNTRPLGIDESGYAGIGLQLMEIHKL